MTRKLQWKKYLTREYSFLYISYAVDCYKIMDEVVGTTLEYDISYGQEELVTLYGIEEDIHHSYELIERIVSSDPQRVEKMMRSFHVLVETNYKLFAAIRKESDKRKIRELLEELDAIFLKTLCHYLFFVYLGYAGDFESVKAFLVKHTNAIRKIRLCTIDTDMNVIFPELFGKYDEKLSDSARYMTRKELLRYLDGKKIDWKKVSGRKTSYLLVTKQGRTREFELSNVQETLNRELGSLTLDSGQDSVKGRIACKGKVVGKARIIFTKNDYRKIKRGDIVVTPMTKPDIEPYLNEAVGIITNDGGALSHASIISREMKIPCIVDTMVATDIFHDDDTVMLDANIGEAKRVDSEPDIESVPRNGGVWRLGSDEKREADGHTAETEVEKKHNGIHIGE